MNTVLLVSRQATALLEGVDAVRLADGSIAVQAGAAGPTPIRLLVASTATEAIEALRSTPVAGLVLDVRDHGDPLPADTREVLDRVQDDSLDVLVARDRIFGLVRGPHATAAAFALGASGVGHVLIAPSGPELVERLGRLSARRTGRIALCLAGGGIEGLLYELGVLRALDAFLVNRPVVDFDLFCGISAGAVIAALLANGLGPDEIARGLAEGSARLDAIGRRDLFDPNVGEVGERLVGLLRDVLRRGGGPRALAGALMRAVPSAAFAGDRLRAWLARQFARPGMSDRFETLRRPLFVGATDQDTSEAVVFGMPGFDHVPVHRAVRASCALIPFYRPEVIDGRRYIDGAFSRTTNMRVAVDQGATLVVLVDPLVPVHADEPGHVYRRGGVFCTMQGLKALIHQRFGKAHVAIRRMFPDVAFHLFRPEGREMRVLSGSPMKYFYRPEIAEMAYEATVRRLRTRGASSSATSPRTG
ncbi:MAG: patatin-like phospholipase family protein [Myxococcales bacterium]|nr:patatin-like phospholipase family protein [Myxococcales bacterium]